MSEYHRVQAEAKARNLLAKGSLEEIKARIDADKRKGSKPKPSPKKASPKKASPKKALQKELDNELLNFYEKKVINDRYYDLNTDKLEEAKYVEDEELEEKGWARLAELGVTVYYDLPDTTSLDQQVPGWVVEFNGNHFFKSLSDAISFIFSASRDKENLMSINKYAHQIIKKQMNYVFGPKHRLTINPIIFE